MLGISARPRHLVQALLVTLSLASCGGGGRSTPDASVDAPTVDAPTVDGVAGDGGPNCAASPASCEYTGMGLQVGCVGCTGSPATTITDPMTGRELPLAIHFPQRAGTYPVVVWSHGGGLLPAGQTQGRAWGEAIAAGGYVVVHLAHVPLTPTVSAALCRLASIPDAECRDGTDPRDEEAPFVTVVRPRDVAAVIDQLPAIQTRFAGAGRPTFDPSQLVVAGWSAGSRASSMFYGAARRLTASIPAYTFTDRRPLAAVMVSPAGPGFFGYFADATGDSFSAMRGPVLVMTGNNDVKPDNMDLTGAIRRMAFDLQPADGMRRMLFSRLPAGVGAHETYDLENLGSPDARLDRLSRALRSTMLAFLDATVRRDAAAAAWLDAGMPSRLAGDAEWTRR